MKESRNDEGRNREEEMDLTELFHKSALTKSEVTYLEQLYALQQDYPLLKDATLIGGLAGKLTIAPRYRSRLPLITDVDLLVPEFPSELEGRIHEERLIDVFYHATGTSKEVKQFRESEFSCYKFNNGHEVDLFVSSIANIVVPKNLSVTSATIELSRGRLDVQIAHPGLLLATYLNPLALNEKRTNRAMLLTETLRHVSPKELEDAYHLCSVLFTQSMMPPETDRQLRHAAMTYRSVSPAFAELAEQLSRDAKTL